MKFNELNTVKGKIVPIRDHVLVADMNFGEQYTASGIFIPSDDGKSEGVKPRWGRVWAIGHEQQDFKVGEWVLVEHGRWTRGVTVEDENGEPIIVRRVDHNSIIGSTDERPKDAEFGAFTSVTQSQSHRPEDFIQPR